MHCKFQYDKNVKNQPIEPSTKNQKSSYKDNKRFLPDTKGIMLNSAEIEYQQD